MQSSAAPRRLLPIVALIAAGSPAFAGTLLVDDDGGPGVFTTIQAAIAAAAPGDVILVSPGNYAGFALDKPLSILGVEDPNLANQTRVTTAVTVRDIPPGESAAVSSLIFSGTVTVAESAGLVVLDRLWLNTLRIQQCADVRAHMLLNLGGGANQISNSSVEIVESHLAGDSGYDCSCCNAGPGSSGLTVNGSSVVHLVRTTVTGGSGGDVGCSFFDAGDAGDGLVVGPGAIVHVSGESGTLLRGGDGGIGDSCFWDGTAGA